MKDRRASRILAGSLALVMGFTVSAQETAPAKPLGTFAWDSSRGSVVLQTYERFITISISFLVSQSRGGIPQPTVTRRIPTEEMDSWVLLTDGKTLEQTKKDPINGGRGIPGAGNAGSGYSFVTFTFTPDTQARPTAVVVKMEGQYYVFRVPNG